jgi:hypothetical protein
LQICPPFIVFVSVILGIFTKGTVSVSNTMVSEASEHHGIFEKAYGVKEFITNIGTTLHCFSRDFFQINSVLFLHFRQWELQRS